MFPKRLTSEDNKVVYIGYDYSKNKIVNDNNLTIPSDENTTSLTKEHTASELRNTKSEQIAQFFTCKEPEMTLNLININKNMKCPGTLPIKQYFTETISNNLTKVDTQESTSKNSKVESPGNKYAKNEAVIDDNLIFKSEQDSRIIQHTANSPTELKDVVVPLVTQVNAIDHQLKKQYCCQGDYIGYKSNAQTINNRQIEVSNKEDEKKDALHGTDQFLEKSVLKTEVRDKVGRHIAKKISGKFPQKLYHSSSPSCYKQQNCENKKLSEEIILNDVNFVYKSHNIVHSFESILDNNVPVVGVEEVVETDNSSFPHYIHNSDIEDLNYPDSLSSVKTVTKRRSNKKSKIKEKSNPVMLKRGKRKINVFDDQHIKTIRQKKKNAVTFEPTNRTTEVSSRTVKKRFKCDVCSKAFPFSSHLIRHLNMHTGIKRYTCDYCEQKFVNNYNLSVHMLKHTGQYPLKCELCSKGFPNPSLLKRHKASHTGETNFQCRYCLVKFTQSSSLKLHEKMHLHRPSYYCDVCCKEFSYTNSLAAHKKLHFGGERYTCNICLVTFSRKSSLVRHMEGHSKSKRIKCRLCDISFNTKTNYYSHLKTHCKYKCDICGQGFQTKINLVNHVKTHKNRLKCEQCLKVFQNKTQLVKHLQKHIR